MKRTHLFKKMMLQLDTHYTEDPLVQTYYETRTFESACYPYHSLNVEEKKSLQKTWGFMAFKTNYDIAAFKKMLYDNPRL